MYSIKNLGRAGPRILFVHGLYSSSGAWIPVLSHFKNTRITLITVNYHNALTAGVLNNLVDKIASEISTDFDICIGHSFGSTFLKFLNVQSVCSVYIAPPFLATVFAAERYSKFISSSTKYNSEDISLVVGRAIEMVKKTGYLFSSTDHFLLPSDDEFFEYDSSNRLVKYFSGNHSDVVRAVNYLLDKNLIFY